MSSRFKIVAILFAWLLATGAQWDVVQTVGWARMIARYAETMSISQAVEKTFGNAVCGICEAVDYAKQAEATAVPNDAAKAKVVLLCPSAPRYVFAMNLGQYCPLGDWLPLSASRSAPPTPPPRAV